MQLHPDDNFPSVISSSSRGTFSCPNNFYWEVIRGKRLKEANFHLDAGKAYAVGLETARLFYYSPTNNDIPEPERNHQAIALGLEALTRSYGAEDPPESQFWKGYERIVGAFAEYFIQYPLTHDKLAPMRKADGEAAVEFSFVFDIPNTKHPITGDPILYSGRCDMLAEWNNSIWVFDDKTTTQLGASWKMQWELRSQFTGYIYGAWQHGIKPVGAIIRGMALPKTKGWPNYRTQEAFVTRSNPMINRWLTRLSHDTNRMCWHWENGYWPHYGEESGKCNDYGGCAFRTMCTAANPESLLDIYYKTYRWDPVEGIEVSDPTAHPAIVRKDDKYEVIT